MGFACCERGHKRKLPLAERRKLSILKRLEGKGSPKERSAKS